MRRLGSNRKDNRITDSDRVRAAAQPRSGHHAAATRAARSLTLYAPPTAPPLLRLICEPRSTSSRADRAPSSRQMANAAGICSRRSPAAIAALTSHYPCRASSNY